MLLLVPDSLREAALALGAPRWRVLSAGRPAHRRPGLFTGSLLAVARGMGETAPLLFTVGTAFGLTGNLGAQMNTLPFQIYTDIQSPRVGDRDAGLGRGSHPGGARADPQHHRSGIARRSRMA